MYVVELCLVAGEATLCYYELIKVLFSVFWVWSLLVAVHALLLRCLSLRFRKTWSGFPSGTCAAKCWNILVSVYSSPNRTFIHWWVPIGGMFFAVGSFITAHCHVTFCHICEHTQEPPSDRSLKYGSTMCVHVFHVGEKLRRYYFPAPFVELLGFQCCIRYSFCIFGGC